MKKPDQYRQGHILLERQKRVPAGAVKADYTPGHVVIARGETGREHVFRSERVTLFQHDGSLYIEITGDEPVYLEHEQHGMIELDPGSWKVIEQIEANPDDDRPPRRSFPD